MILTPAIVCLALNIYHESKGEPVRGMKAVAQVTLNRANHEPERVCGEVFKPYQFSWTIPLKGKDIETRRKRAVASVQHLDKKHLRYWNVSLSIAKDALSGKLENIVGKARYFHNPEISTVKWHNTKQFVAQIGNHRFYY